MSEAEKPRSVLFAELSGNARLHEKLENSEALRAVERCTRRMQRAVEACGGSVVKSAEDRLIAVFGLADEAFHAAIEMQQRVGDLPPVSGVKLAIRVSFAHGPLREENAGVAGATVDLAARLAALAKPGQILTDSAARAALSMALQPSARDLGAADGGQDGAARIFELVAADLPALLVKPLVDPPAQPPGAQGPCLRLSYAGKDHFLDDTTPVITLGRGANNEVIVNDRRASRNHARIERRGEQIMVIDTSTNGTYVTLQGMPELSLRKGDCVIRGKGVICFAAPATDAQADCADFETF
jgi:class 3 adenylate cyclase